MDEVHFGKVPRFPLATMVDAPRGEDCYHRQTFLQRTGANRWLNTRLMQLLLVRVQADITPQSASAS
jgi:hypothetical protein